MGPLAFILPLLQSLFNVFEPLAKAKLTETMNKQVKDPIMSQQMATELMAIVKQAAGMTAPPPHTPTTPVDPAVQQAEQIAQAAQAVAKVKADAALLESVEHNMLDYLDRIAPVMDRISALEQQSWKASEDSMDRAAARSASGNDDWMAKSLVMGVLGTAIC